jgi:uncharacterized protein YjbI with pentapeptide repeats
MKFTFILAAIFYVHFSFASDLGFRFKEGKCVNAEGAEGLNPGFIGQCGDLRLNIIGNMDWVDMDLRGSRFDQATLTKIKFSNADVSDTSFELAALVEVDLSKQKIKNVNFTNAKFVNSNFSKTSFENVKMMDVELREANLDGVVLKDIDFTKSNFFKASLKGADLRGAKMEKCDLRRADLSKVKYDGAKFTDSIFNKKTILPFSVDEAKGLGMVLKVDGFAEVNGKTYAKVPVKGKMTDLNIYETCKAEEMDVPCNSEPNGSYSDGKCVDVGWRDNGNPMNTLAVAICNTTPPGCKILDQTFQYMGEKWYGGCGVMNGGWCYQGNDYSDYFALCVDTAN